MCLRGFSRTEACILDITDSRQRLESHDCDSVMVSKTWEKNEKPNFHLTYRKLKEEVLSQSGPVSFSNGPWIKKTL